jgi:hypothetical protein
MKLSLKAFVNYYDALEGARSDVSDLAPVIEDYFMKEVDNTFAKQLGFNILALVWIITSNQLSCWMLKLIRVLVYWSYHRPINRTR